MLVTQTLGKYSKPSYQNLNQLKYTPKNLPKITNQH